MPQVTLRAKTNDGLVALSAAHEGAAFSVLGAWPDGENLRLLVETGDVALDALESTLERIPEVLSFDFRRADDRRIRFEVTTPMSEPHGAMADSGVVPAFPLRLEGGWLVGDLVASRDRLSAFRDELRAADLEFRIERVAETSSTGRLLTERQREVIDAALEHGYYDFPRACSLTELAEHLGVDKSVVSRVLQRAEGRIVDDYRSATGDEWGER